MALIIEDGTIVTNSNSYVDDAEYVDYAADRGLTIGADATAREQELIRAMDYIESHRDEFKGLKATRDQSLQWPRFDVWMDGYQLDSNTIPLELKRAQMEAAAINNSDTIMKSGTSQNIQKEKLDTLEVSYFSGGSWESAQTGTVDIYLDPLLESGGSSLTSIRV
jgi:hypothetical protein